MDRRRYALINDIDTISCIGGQPHRKHRRLHDRVHGLLQDRKGQFTLPARKPNLINNQEDEHTPCTQSNKQPAG